jgi:hypothetical protein
MQWRLARACCESGSECETLSHTSSQTLSNPRFFDEVPDKVFDKGQKITLLQQALAKIHANPNPR